MSPWSLLSLLLPSTPRATANSSRTSNPLSSSKRRGRLALVDPARNSSSSLLSSTKSGELSPLSPLSPRFSLLSLPLSSLSLSLCMCVCQGPRELPLKNAKWTTTTDITSPSDFCPVPGRKSCLLCARALNNLDPCFKRGPYTIKEGNPLVRVQGDVITMQWGSNSLSPFIFRLCAKSRCLCRVSL